VTNNGVTIAEAEQGGRIIMNSKRDVQDECMFHVQLQHLTVKED